MDVQSTEVSINAEDMQCGFIYLNEPLMMLKFYCIFCQKTFDDIHYYCNHLTEHVEEVTIIKSEAADQVPSSEIILDADQYEGSDSLTVEKFLEEKEINPASKSQPVMESDDLGSQFNGCDENRCPEGLYEYEEGLDNDKEEGEQYFFDKIDCLTGEEGDVRKIAFITETEPREHMGGGNIESPNVNVEDCPAQIATSETGDNMDFENLIGNAKIIKPHKIATFEAVSATTAEPPTSSVKTFKIITLNNQIEELYSMVTQTQSERLKESNHHDEALHSSVACFRQKGIARTTRIIGETVITSLPVEINVPQTDVSKNEYKCHACDKVFRNRHSLSLHGRAHYMESQSDVKVAHRCTECNELFNKMKDLQLHIQKVHYPDGFKCRLCHKVLRSVNLLEVHMRKMHLMTTSFRCRLCGRTNFNNAELFEEHTKTHEKDHGFKCYICGKQYRVEGNLKQHVLRHAIKRAERCVVCGKVTQRLAQHMKMHSPRPTRLLQCSICNKTFAYSSALSRHTKVMHKLPRTGRVKVVRTDNRNTITKRRRRSRKLNNTENNPEISLEIKTDVKNENAYEEEDIDDGTKRVVVEIIENGTRRRTWHESDIFDNMDCTVARYETISAVQSITSPKKES